MICLKKMAALTACSDPLNRGEEKKVERLIKILENMGLSVLVSPHLYGEPDERPLGREKAEILMECYENPEVEAVFDISGGNLANELLPYLDVERIRKHPKPFFGYSDLTVLLNALNRETGQSNVLYSIKNLVRENGEEQQAAFQKTFCSGGNDLTDFPLEFLKGNQMEGVVAGGNIRCLLKLAGTKWFPDLKGKILFLESMSGNRAFLTSLCFQLLEMGVFEEISGLILGTFTELEKAEGPYAVQKVLDIPLPETLPIAKTWSIGHGADSKALVIGEKLRRTNTN